MCLSHRDGWVHLVLINTHVNLPIHRIIIRPTCRILHVTWQRALHGLAIEHMIDLVSTIFRLSVSVSFATKWLFISIILFLTHHHGWLNLRLNNWSSQLLLHLSRQFIVLTTRWWKWFSIDRPTWFLSLMLVSIKSELVLWTFLA